MKKITLYQLVVFKTIIPLTVQDTVQDTMQDSDRIKKLLEFCNISRTRNEMQEFMQLKNREHFRKNNIKSID